MGTASVVVYEEVLHLLQDDPETVVHTSRQWSEDTWYCVIEHETLPPGYNGVMSVTLVNGDIRFKRDMDT
jgi:hypothetical protein